MSRIGKKPIALPSGVSIKIDKGDIEVKGPKGTLKRSFSPEFEFKLENGELSIVCPSQERQHKSLYGLYRTLIMNMVTGVSQGFTKQMELIGVGYKAETKGNNVLELNLGYSHNIYFRMPDEIKCSAVMQKGQAPTITLESIDKELIGHIAAKIRSLRKPEPYKGKGIKFSGEIIRRKAGKSKGK
jgi:large subunit ribosomal protein L6